MEETPVPHTAVPWTLLAQSTQSMTGVPAEHSDGRPGHGPQEEGRKNQPGSHVT